MRFLPAAHAIRNYRLTRLLGHDDALDAILYANARGDFTGQESDKGFENGFLDLSCSFFFHHFLFYWYYLSFFLPFSHTTNNVTMETTVVKCGTQKCIARVSHFDNEFPSSVRFGTLVFVFFFSSTFYFADNAYCMVRTTVNLLSRSDDVCQY